MIRPAVLSATLIAVLIQSAGSTPPPQFEKGFTPLFDGKTLKGWEGNPRMFRVEKQAIVAGTLKAKVPHNDFLCSTRRFGDFELRLQARLIGKGNNAGVQFRSSRIPNHFEVKGYQCDIGTMQNRPIWGSLYDESRRRKFLAEGAKQKLAAVLRRPDKKQEGWNDLVIRCEGPRVRIWVNGFQTVDYVEKAKEIPRTGIIGLQIHGGAPAEAWYRRIRIRQL